MNIGIASVVEFLRCSTIFAKERADGWWSYLLRQGLRWLIDREEREWSEMEK
jgi:hypothetical protein